MAENTGYALKWVIGSKQTPCYFPGKRMAYKIGVKEMCLKARVVDDVRHLSVCISPPVNVQTMLANQCSVSSIKTVFVDEDVYIRDYSQHIDYYNIDLRYNDKVRIWVVDNQGKEVNVEAMLLLDIQEC